MVFLNILFTFTFSLFDEGWFLNFIPNSAKSVFVGYKFGITWDGEIKSCEQIIFNTFPAYHNR